MVGLVVYRFDEYEFHGFWGFFSPKLAVVGEINKKVSLFCFLSFFLEKSALSGRSKTKEIELISETLISKSLVGFLQSFVFEFFRLRDISSSSSSFVLPCCVLQLCLLQH
jgi:hypothetical protein